MSKKKEQAVRDLGMEVINSKTYGKVVPLYDVYVFVERMNELIREHSPELMKLIEEEAGGMH